MTVISSHLLAARSFLTPSPNTATCYCWYRNPSSPLQGSIHQGSELLRLLLGSAGGQRPKAEARLQAAGAGAARRLPHRCLQC